MGPLDKEKFAQAINGIKADAAGATFLPRALRDIEPVLQGTSGKTVVFVFSDGSLQRDRTGDERPRRYDHGTGRKIQCMFLCHRRSALRPGIKNGWRTWRKSNECSRLIPFAKFVKNPQYNSGALYRGQNNLGSSNDNRNEDRWSQG